MSTLISIVTDGLSNKYIIPTQALTAGDTIAFTIKDTEGGSVSSPWGQLKLTAASSVFELLDDGDPWILPAGYTLTVDLDLATPADDTPTGEVKSFVGTIPVGYTEVANTLENTAQFTKIGTYSNQVLQTVDKLDGFLPFRALDSNPNGLDGMFINPIQNSTLQLKVGFIDMDFMANPVNYYNVYAAGIKKQDATEINFTNYLDTILSNAVIVTANKINNLSKPNINGIQPWYLPVTSQVGLNDMWAIKQGDNIYAGGVSITGSYAFRASISGDTYTVENSYSTGVPYPIFSQGGINAIVVDSINFAGGIFNNTQAKLYRVFNAWTEDTEAGTLVPTLTNFDKVYIVNNPIQAFTLGGVLYWLCEDGYIYKATDTVIGLNETLGDVLTQYAVQQVCVAPFEAVGYVNYFETSVSTTMTTKLVGFKFNRVLTEIGVDDLFNGNTQVLNYNSYTLYDLSNIEQVIAMTKKTAIKL